MNVPAYRGAWTRRRLLGGAAAGGATALAGLAGLAGPARRTSAHEGPVGGTPAAEAGAGATDPPIACLSEEELADLPALEPMAPNGVEALIGLFDDYSLVALGEDHGIWEIHDFVWSVLRHPAFPAKANALVVEFGNARYQDVIDAYVAGEDVPREELVRVWRDTTQSGTLVWDSPIYAQTFAVVREVNQRLEPERRIRVLLGDPPIDWAAVTNRDDVLRFLHQRDQHYAAVVQREVLDRGDRALMIAGFLHVQRLPPPPPGYTGPYNPGVVSRLDESAPGQTIVLALATGVGIDLDPARARERRLAAELPVPSIARLPGTWFGATGCITIPGVADVRAEDQADAVYYVGPGDTLTQAEPSPFLYAAEPEYFAEVQRRHALLHGEPLPLDEPRYVLHGEPGIIRRGAIEGGGDVVSIEPETPPAAPGTPAAPAPSNP